MVNRAFRLQQVRIEGFKGFTASQTMPVNGRHLFVLGPNSYGKSSIVEGIRWGLFGSTRRRGEVVSNQTYPGSCRVELLLARDDGTWTLKRNLIRGASGGSDAEITDQSGQSHLLTEIMPQLESAPAGEGMHIVYAAQSAPFKRSVEDLSPFERTIFSYLGLTDVRMSISGLDNFIELYQETESQLAERVDEERKRIESELSRLTELRHRIIETPPWGEGSIPTQAQTVGKIEQFIKDLAAIIHLDSLPSLELELGALLRELESLFEHASSIKRSEAEAALSETQQKLRQAHDYSTELLKIVSHMEQLEEESASAERKRAELLNGQSLEMVASVLEEAEVGVNETALLLEVQKKSRLWLEQGGQGSTEQSCPVCEQQLASIDVIRQLDAKVASASSKEAEAIAKRDAIRHQYEQAMRLTNESNDLRSGHSDLKKQLEQLQTKILEFIGPSPHGGEPRSALQTHIEQLDNTKQVLEKQLQEASALQQEWKRKLDLLRQEVYFHRLQNQLVDFQKQEKQLAPVQASLDNLSLFGDSIRLIDERLKEALNSALKDALPNIDMKLTDAFRALTEHPAYSRVFIDDSALPRLELRVGSDDSPLASWEPAQVLNGQALNALELVPYFAFSELTDMPFEVYLLLLDDPTQSFDAHHIGILIEKLAQLGKRVQLIVASHETDHFQRLLPQFFEPEQYEIIRVAGFTRHEGPVLELLHGGS